MILMKNCSILLIVCLTQLGLLTGAAHAFQDQEPIAINVFGFTMLPKENAPETFDAGFSMYPTIWSLVETHPGKRYQSGLFGTWMKIKTEEPMDGKIGAEKTGGLGYNSVEGGSGVWRHNRFPTITPKFQMGGVAVSFKGIANGPGFGKGRDWNVDKGRYGVAQLSNRVVFPLDGLNYKQGTFGQSFGYGYLPLPLTEAKTKTAGKDVPTGNQSWTLFINSKTFKGPLTFFTPYFWSRHTIEYPHLHGKLFDSSPNKPNRQIQMETQHISAIQATAKNGDQYARTTRIRFPLNKDGSSPVLTRNTCYDKSALWDEVDAWFKGGPVASGQIKETGSFSTKVRGGNNNTWRLNLKKKDGEKIRHPIDWRSFVKRAESDEYTFSLRFDPEKTEHDQKNGWVTLPEYYKLVKGAKKLKWVPVAKNTVPRETGLQKLSAADFYTGKNNSQPWTTPDDPKSVWKNPGPAAGPFKAKLGDGSTLTYHWYKFNEQPSIMMADLSDSERADLQKKIELIHQHWTPDREYLPAPKGRELAELDPAIIVTPPKGMEVGYVPIATRQEKTATNIKHSFIGAGRANGIVIFDEDGEVEWQYKKPASDAWMLESGNVLAALYPTKDFPNGGVAEIDRKSKEILWSYQGQQKEISTVQKIGDDEYLVAELGAKPKVVVINRDGEVLRETPLQCQTGASNREVHMQTRMVRMLPGGNYLAPHLLDFAVKEYDPSTGEVVRTIATDDRGRKKRDWPFSAIRLENGNTLISCTNGNRVIEVDGENQIVWSVDNNDLAEPMISDACGAQRLPNGNTVIASYGAKNDKVKLLEVTPDKEIVWTFNGLKSGFHHFQVLTTNGQSLSSALK